MKIDPYFSDKNVGQ